MSPVIPLAEWADPPVVATDIDEALLAQFRLWLPTYIAHTNAARGVHIPDPNTYASVLETAEIMDHMIPMVLVTTAETPRVKGGGNFTYEANWRVTISSVARGRKPSETRLNASLLEGVVRECVLQKGRTEEGPVDDIDWVSMKLAPVPDPSGEGRYLAAGVGTYNVQTDVAARGFGGPNVPAEPEYLEEPDVVTITTGVSAK